jgi:hypothetical protein
MDPAGREPERLKPPVEGREWAAMAAAPSEDPVTDPAAQLAVYRASTFSSVRLYVEALSAAHANVSCDTPIRFPAQPM